MAEEEVTVHLDDNFYRDSFGKVIIIMICVVIAIFSLIALSVYLYLDKPRPITFDVGDEWRILKPVPLDQPYLSTPDVLQWVTNALTRAMVFDFIHYDDQLKRATPFFTSQGWPIFLNQLNIYANADTVRTNKQFINGLPAGAPFILNQGLLSGRYAWWIQIPFALNYGSYNRAYSTNITFQILVVRVPTLNNLNGVGIDNILVAKTGNQGGL